MPQILNICAYRFVAIDDPQRLRDAIARQATALALRGSVLIAAEGINLFLAGTPAAVREFIAWLRADERFAGLRPNESGSNELPFGRLRVKVKAEIIRMDQPAVRPGAGRAPAVDAATLACWLDDGRDAAGRPLLLLDTRNAFEVDLGRFRGALDWRLGRFGEFPATARRHCDRLAGATVVTYCTGGIRCEKAALFLAQAGVDNVLQLEGGILGYFQSVGNRHFDGDCFVFDQRMALDADRARPPGGHASAALPA